MLLCYEDEGVYVNTYGRIIKDVVLQWGEMPTSVGKRRATSQTACPEGTRTTTSSRPFYRPLPSAYICSNQIMGWGEKAIEIRSVETGHLDGVFMHKRAQRLKFLCERNDKVRRPCGPCAGQVWGAECFYSSPQSSASLWKLPEQPRPSPGFCCLYPRGLVTHLCLSWGAVGGETPVLVKLLSLVFPS